MADWTEKYRPTTLGELRGNDKARDQLREWADTWSEHREAVVLYGRPGVGKTSAAHALANDYGWTVVELNASDQRTAEVVERLAGRAAKNYSIDTAITATEPRNTTQHQSNSGRQLVILDEADNLHGNIDRGGSKAITDVIRESGQPILLIANEYYDMTQGLRNACRDIEFRDVNSRSILPVLRDICRQEDITFEEPALVEIADRNNGDLRGAINDLQAIADTTTTLTESDVVTNERNQSKGIFEFLDAVFKEAAPEDALRMSYDVDETPDDLIGWIEDNVSKDYTGRELAVAYDFLANADKWLGRVRKTQEYRYWRYATDEMTAGVAAARRTSKANWTRYGPPSFWRKLGSSRSTRDRRDDIARRIAERSGVSVSTARQTILPYLSEMTHHCKNRELTVVMAAAYDLDADHLSFITGSGSETNKVQEILEDAESMRDAAAFEHAGFFEETTDSDEEPSDSAEIEEDSSESGAVDTQMGLTDFS